MFRSTLAIALLGIPFTSCQAPKGAVDTEFAVIALEHAEARPLTKSLQGVFADSTMRVEADVRTNSILLAGAPEEMADAREVVAQLDVEVVSQDPQASFEMIVLEHALASDVQRSLREVVGPRGSQISVDARTNALLVSASPDTMVEIKELIVQLDRPQ